MNPLPVLLSRSTGLLLRLTLCTDPRCSTRPYCELSVQGCVGPRLVGIAERWDGVASSSDHGAGPIQDWAPDLKRSGKRAIIGAEDDHFHAPDPGHQVSLRRRSGPTN